MGNTMDMNELLEQHRAHQAELERIVTIQEGYIVINVRYEYNIALERCKTHADILGWTFQLSEKTWMTPALLRHFIKVATEANGLRVPSP